MEVAIEVLAPRTAVLLRHVGPYTEVVAAFGRLSEWFDATGRFGPETGVLGFSHDSPLLVPAEKLRYDAAFTVPEPVADLPEGFRCETVLGGRYAVAIHKGAFAGMGESFGRIFDEWLPGSGERFACGKPCAELYLSPWNTPEAELRTKIGVPLL